MINCPISLSTGKGPPVIRGRIPEGGRELAEALVSGSALVICLAQPVQVYSLLSSGAPHKSPRSRRVPAFGSVWKDSHPCRPPDPALDRLSWYARSRRLPADAFRCLSLFPEVPR